MRLIDADDARNAKFPKVPEGITEVYVKGWNDAIDAIVDNAPTVDKGYQEGHIDGVLQAEKLYARPTGEWITEDKLYGGYGDTVLVNTCSNCKTSFVYREKTHNFCANCGADMRGGRE